MVKGEQAHLPDLPDHAAQALPVLESDRAQASCEMLQDGNNVSFLEPTHAKHGYGTGGTTEEDDKRDFTMSAPFAAGAVYANSLQDKMAVQVFYNPNLLRIIRELVVGQAQEQEYPVRHVLAAS